MGAESQNVVQDRPVWRTQKVRATDLVAGDVTRNRYGKWDVVVGVNKPNDRYVNVDCEAGGVSQVRTVHLVDVQVVKPS